MHRMTPAEKPDYGLDAPGVIRNCFLIAAVGFAVNLTATFGLWSGVLFDVPLAVIGLIFGIMFLATGFLMIYYSIDGKLRQRERALNLVPWRGDEMVLDVGCGRGLMLCGAAKRLSAGKAVGIDIWQTQDLSGNTQEATLENARREGVLEKVEIRTADMKLIPFPDASFDVIVTCAAIHNLYKAEERAEALKEIARVLKPGGIVVITDIGLLREYETQLKMNGLDEFRRAPTDWLSLSLMILTFGNLNLGTLIGRKPAIAPEFN
jgi:SAM-dependent methyltransferase